MSHHKFFRLLCGLCTQRAYEAERMIAHDVEMPPGLKASSSNMVLELPGLKTLIFKLFS